jgi:hypothetical protein
VARRRIIYWDGPKPPTRRELAAIARAVRAGRVRAGDHVSCARARRNPAPTAAESAYREFHWGKPPRRRRLAEVPTPAEVFELGKLLYVEYLARKGDQTAIWCHDFSRPLPSLTGTANGELGPIVGGSAKVTERGIVG